jgi:hypothetical protein
MYHKMMFHHDYLRGQVYESTRPPDCTSCLDHCFDCTVLWDTLSSYAKKNSREPIDIVKKIIQHHVYTPRQKNWDGDYTTWKWRPPNAWQRYWDVDLSLRRGNLMEAIAILEAEGEEDPEGTDWRRLARGIASDQKNLATRMRLGLYRPAKREALVTLLGQLSDPFTLLRTDLNSVGQTEPEAYWAQNAKHAAYIEASWKESSKDAENQMGNPTDAIVPNGLSSPLVKRQKVNGAELENVDANGLANGTTAKVSDSPELKNKEYESTKAAKKARRWNGVPCRHFMKGNCSFGASCGFLHAMVECPYFAINSCFHGDDCSYLHESRPDQSAPETKVCSEITLSEQPADAQ